jgi:DNA-binding MarR family transcriptional regulator
MSQRSALDHCHDAAAPPANPADLPLEQQLSYRLHLLNKLSDAASAEAYLRECALPLSEARCLAAAGSFAPLSVVELGQRANLDKGQASRAAQALVDRGLIHKTASATDGRGVVLTLTEAGLAMHQHVMTLIRRRNDEIFGCLSAAERQQLGELLERLLGHARSSCAGKKKAPLPGA